MRTVDIQELEQRLAAARRVVERSGATLRGKGGEDAMGDYEKSLQAQRAAERDLALARGEQACMPLSWQPRWSPGAPCPHVVAGTKTFLVYIVHDVDPNWDGSTSRMVDTSAAGKERLAVVEFHRCYGHRFGGPNDEVWRGHPLYGKGLDFYGAHVVANSQWIAVERATNKVHPHFRADRWDRLQHFLLLFHDQIFECLAEGYAIEETVASMGDVLETLTRR
jgi:hypothetical protein